jgi:hypothetical protein
MMRRSFSFSFFLLSFFVGGVLVAFWRGRSCVLEGYTAPLARHPTGSSSSRAPIVFRSRGTTSAVTLIWFSAGLWAGVCNTRGSSLVGW